MMLSVNLATKEMDPEILQENVDNVFHIKLTSGAVGDALRGMYILPVDLVEVNLY
jgi:hypothetical protein